MTRFNLFHQIRKIPQRDLERSEREREREREAFQKIQIHSYCSSSSVIVSTSLNQILNCGDTARERENVKPSIRKKFHSCCSTSVIEST